MAFSVFYSFWALQNTPKTHLLLSQSIPSAKKQTQSASHLLEVRNHMLHFMLFAAKVAPTVL
jgi:hypothetical protein